MDGIGSINWFQWSKLNQNETTYVMTFNFPISFNNLIGGVGITDFNVGNNPGLFSFYNENLISSSISMRRYGSTSTEKNGVYGRVIMVGY